MLYYVESVKIFFSKNVIMVLRARASAASIRICPFAFLLVIPGPPSEVYPILALRSPISIVIFFSLSLF